MGGYCGTCQIMTAGHLVFLQTKRRLVCVNCFRRLTGRYPLPSLRGGAGLLELHTGGRLLPPVIQDPCGPGAAPQRISLYVPGVIQYSYGHGSASPGTTLYTPGVIHYSYGPYFNWSQSAWNLAGIVAAQIAIPGISDDDDKA